MLNTALRFMSECDRVGLRYRESRDLEDGGSLVICGVEGKNNARYNVLFLFDPNQRAVSLRVPALLQFGPEKAAEMTGVCNENNGAYRWLKFFTKDNRVWAQADAIITEDNADRVCMELMLRTMKIIDEVYPKYMRALWS